MENNVDNITRAPAPWKCTAQLYSMFFYSRPDEKLARDVSTVAYSPLEAESYFGAPQAGRFVGGLGGFVLVRHTDSPVGKYDELVIIPGSYTHHMNNNDRALEKRNLRISRVYVSQRHTLYNGRRNWNIPKHLARFDWQDLPNGGIQVKVFPHDTAGDNAEAAPSPTPLFQASFKTLPLVPSFPFSTGWAKYVGLDLNFVQPPVPQGVPSEVVGTEEWCKCIITQSSSQTHVGWFDISQRDVDGKLTALFDNFWPGLGRWHLGVRMDNATIDVPEGEFWAGKPIS